MGLRKIFKKLLGVLPVGILPVKTQLSIKYYKIFGVFPDLNNPKLFNEKILHRIINDRSKEYVMFADKYEVRKYVENCIGAKHLVPLIDVYTDPNELYSLIKWKDIVIKPNHGAGMVRVIENEPSRKEQEEIIQETKNWLAFDFGRHTGEWHYSLITPKIIVEEKIIGVGKSLKDYKFHRFVDEFGGFKQLLQIVSERSKTGFETVFYDLDDLDHIIHSPSGYEEFLSDYEKTVVKEISKLNTKLCPDLNYVRLDWYISENDFYFGEITLTPGCGLSWNFRGNFGIELGKLWIDKIT